MDSHTTPADREQLTRSLSVHGQQRRAPTRRLNELLTRVEDGDLDTYGRGGAVARLEHRVADLLGKEAAVFMPTGAMATQVALRLHADARTCRTIGFHPRAHIEVHELKGYEIVHQLHGKLLGDHDRLVTLQDLEAVREPLAAVLLELPQRDLGGLLPTWEELTAQTSWLRTRGIAAHLDGARLWEAQPYYGRPHAEIAALFDTVYVSLYKGLEGLAGAVLAGPSDLVNQAREWRDRLGGKLHHAWPLAVSAELGLDGLVPRMPAFWERARELAAALRDIPGVEVLPDPPQTPLFHVIVPVPPQALAAAHQRFVERRGLELFLYPRPTTSPRCSRFEVTVGENAMTIDPHEVRASLIEVLRDAAS
ncbi:beta-eliminating lyase-related protein [Pedococcus sp. KACC 23699]|uniref:Beta-eliminating lyase-related protein n=1 Tax=Pedococcus sp. KACC 23699 TaxID=3149228 RepID=A0AAU7JWH9_9MICO